MRNVHPNVRINGTFVFAGVGNTSACGEFNFYMDPEAAHIVLDSLKCPVTIVPWECCTQDVMNISKVTSECFKLSKGN